jgi:3-oxoacyl-[acyl-carrier-protein] synthase II
VTRIKRFPVEAGSLVAAEIKDFHFERFNSDLSKKRMPRHTQLAVAAARLALDDAGLTFGSLRGNCPAVVVGASLMDFGAINKLVDLAMRKGVAAPAPPATVFTTSVSSISGVIGEFIGGTTRTLALQSACCAGLDAIGHAAEMIATGKTDIALCGGTEAPLHLHPMLELKLAGLTPGGPEHPERQCRPFDLWRDGGALGEGACIMVLEPESSPREGYAFVDGYSFASDPLGFPGLGLGEAIRIAMANASLLPEQLGCINAWGPGHKVIDAAEAATLGQLFAERLSLIPVVSLKGAIGNPLGAAGAIQAAATALGIVHGIVPPTVNWSYPDPACPLNLSSVTRYISHRNAIVNAHGLSGTNACLVLTR